MAIKFLFFLISSLSQPATGLILSDYAHKTITAVATNSVQIVAANPARRALTIYNNSTNSAYITPECPAIAANLMEFLATNAGPTSLTKWFGPVVYTGALCAIRNAGSGNVIVWEFE